MALQTTSTPAAINPDGPKPVVTVTNQALDQIRKLGKSPKYIGKFFRIGVEGGGCSGYQYGFSFDDRKDDDILYNFNELSILVDLHTRPLIHGSVLDFVEDVSSSGFVLQNPNATGSCGCGVSFSV